MFGLRKNIFAGKGNLHSEPFCPCITNDHGFSDLRRNTYPARQSSDLGGFIRTEPTFRPRKSRA